MIGHFYYMAGAPDGEVVLDLGWEGGAPTGRVIASPAVLDVLEGHGVGARSDEEPMSLPLALSYAVLLATLSGASLYLTGDRSAWEPHWGDLFEPLPRQRASLRSH